MSEWAPEEVQAHIDYQRDLNRELAERGSLVDAQALTVPALAKFVIHNGIGAPAVTDGPFPETKELVAGYRIVDVESPERAIEIAARVSAAPAAKRRADPAADRGTGGDGRAKVRVTLGTRASRCVRAVGRRQPMHSSRR